MVQEKKDIVEGMGFGGLAHVPEMNVSDTLLIELLDRFDIERGCLKTLQGTINITPRKVAAALGITNGEKKKKKNKNVERDSSSEEERLSEFKSETQIEQEKDNAAEKRKRALEIIREKRSKKRNDGAQLTNIAPDQFDFPQGQKNFSQTKNTPDSPIKYFRKKKIFPRKTSKTAQVATPESEVQIVEFQQQNRSEPLEVAPLALSLPSLVQEELMKDDFIYVPLINPIFRVYLVLNLEEAEKQGVTVSLTSSVIQDLMKDDYVYEVSNEDPAKEQEQQAQELTVQQESEQEAPVNVRPLEQPCEEPIEQQSKQEAPIDVCPPEPNKQGVTRSITSSVIEQFFKDADVYQVFDEEQSKELPVERQSERKTLILSSFDSLIY
ncbi:hypothetical protein AHAS_Ahas19G0291300 [Arachis hypogaea]